ncbi:probable RNA-directed DNA polymerase from transposon BS [Trichonephila clavipes]|nr:probable RNA-directed DNA polymerase from transposon BS [Trichonephila clavipes]
MEDLLIADQMELLYNDSDIPSYLHYNGNGTNPDLTLASADIADDVEREVICDPGSGHRMIITGIGFDTSNSSKRPFRNRWNFAKADWKNFTLENETILESRFEFLVNTSSTEPLRVGNRVLTNDMDISNSFNSFYSTKQRLKKSLKTRQKKIIGREIRNIASSQSHGHEIFHRNFSISELREAVGHIRCAKSPGPDNFHPEFLKHLGCNALSVLLTLYNHSWKYGVPAIWKKAIVVPIPKKNKPLDDLNSYRPISLTSILSKVMERMITSRLDWYLETNNLLTSSQAGFRKCQSTNQQVVFLGQSIKDALDQRHSALALFVDFEAAFDKSDVSIYLGCALDTKLKWTKHAELVVSKARKRLSILKRLTGVKWECNRDTLNTTYKTYIQPVLNYCNEVLISASENVRKLLDTFHNQALRMITGVVKTAPVLAMQLLCDLQPLTNIIEKNAAILFNRLIRLPNNSFWPDYDSDGGRNLKTQRALFNVFSNCSSRYSFGNYQYPLPTGEVASHYTDGALLDFAQGAGIGVFSHLFSFYLHAGPLTTHFDGEVEAIHIALQQLAVRLPPLKEL